MVFDEFHYMNDPDRGTVWEESVILAPPHVLFVALSATIANVGQVAATPTTEGGREGPSNGQSAASMHACSTHPQSIEHMHSLAGRRRRRPPPAAAEEAALAVVVVVVVRLL